MMMHGNFWAAFTLSLIAGLATGIGSTISLFAKKKETTMLSVGLGFSAGVMIYVSFMDILPVAYKMFAVRSGDAARWLMASGFFFGMIATGVIDAMVPEYSNPHESRDAHDLKVMSDNKGKASDLHEMSKKPEIDQRLMKTGIFVAAAITIHNFPEGLATFFSGYADLKLGIPIAIAIAIHNIPEGISVSVPIFYATGSKKKAFILSFMSGLAEPLSALIGYFFLRPFLNDTVFAASMAIIAGIMVYISLDELLPTARQYGRGHLAIIGMICGMMIMALSLNLIK